MSDPTVCAPWRAGIIAAGWGERLREASATLKPLVTVGGQPLIGRVLGSLAEASPAEVMVIVNEAGTDVRAWAMSRSWPFPVRWVVETTPSSMHSFLRIVEALAAGGDEGPFLVTTVDTVAPPGAFGAFARACRSVDADVTLAVSRQFDDEKPLLVDVAGDGVKVKAIGSMVRAESGPAESGTRYATAGYYAVRAGILREAESARQEGVPALRHFFERLLKRGWKLAALPVDEGVDVDRPEDLRAAEAFVKRIGP